MIRQKKFRVKTSVYGYPNGKIISEDIKYFDTLIEAKKFKKENTFTTPDKTGVADIEIFMPAYVLYEEDDV